MEAKLLERFKGSVSKSTTVKMLPTIKNGKLHPQQTRSKDSELNAHYIFYLFQKLAIKEDVIGIT